MNLDEWAGRLAQCVRLELLFWRGRMSLDRVRALALDCHPWHTNALTLSFLTDRESFPEARLGKWAIADWRLYDFSSAPTSNWPAAQSLMDEAHRLYMAAAPGNESAVRDLLIRSCVMAMKSAEVSDALRSYDLAPDFALFVGHPDAPNKNFLA
jgi:hypothetical protein